MVILRGSGREVEELVYWIAFSEAHIDPHLIATYVKEFGSLEGLWSAPEDYFRSLGLDEGSTRRIMGYKSKADLSQHRELIGLLMKRDIEVIRFVDEDYPIALRAIKGKPPNTPPLLLFKTGSLKKLERCIAVVGTRQCSHHGNMTAREVGRHLAKSGYTVVSGLARGIDTEAHSGALDAGGKTVSVLAWLEPVYPPENRALLDDVLRSGAAISERYFAPKGGAAHLFVERNRITSGISEALVVIESSRTGGTVWQFDFAREQRKPIFVLTPREATPSIARGYRYFVEAGGVPFATADELAEKLNRMVAVGPGAPTESFTL